MDLAFDPGYGNVKLLGPKGPLIMPSSVAVGRGEGMRRMVGLRVVRPPLKVETSAGAFYVGAGAHDWGRPVENLDFDRLNGSTEMLALFLGAISRYGVTTEPVTLIVGLPIATLMGENAQHTQESVVAFLRGTHTWRADGLEQGLTIGQVRTTSQPVGAMFDSCSTMKVKCPWTGAWPSRARLAYWASGSTPSTYWSYGADRPCSASRLARPSAFDACWS